MYKKQKNRFILVFLISFFEIKIIFDYRNKVKICGPKYKYKTFN